jgi:hypothetical protein
MAQAIELTIGRLWTLQVTWCTGAVTRYPASNAREATVLQAVLEAHPKVTDVRRHPYSEADLIPPVVHNHHPPVATGEYAPAVGRVAGYRVELRAVGRRGWTAYLREHSGLPGPRGNIELAQAIADEADPAYVDQLIATGDEYLVFCGVVGLGRRLADGADSEIVERLRGHAADERWRVREAVAMALQRLGDADLPRLEDMVTGWAADPHPLVQRAAVAAICEPRLLATPAAAAHAIEVCAHVTRTLAARPAPERRDPRVRTLRQALGYCWSVAVAAAPAAGLPRFQALEEYDDRDVAWIVRENRRKARLAKLL